MGASSPPCLLYDWYDPSKSCIIKKSILTATDALLICSIPEKTNKQKNKENKTFFFIKTVSYWEYDDIHFI